MERFPEELLAGFPVVVVQEVAWGDMDAYRHVNNVVYFRYFENARLEYLRRLDWGAVEAPTAVGPILASTQARFRRPLAYPDTVALTARVIDLAVDRFTIEHRIVSQRLGSLAAEGQALIVAYHYGESRKAAVPELVRERIGQLEGWPEATPAPDLEKPGPAHD